MSFSLYSQTCTTLGQTPSTAFPVCGTSVFRQNQVPLCTNKENLFVPGCTGGQCVYSDKNPFYYKFRCYQSGTLGFTITPLAANEDYDWQLWDITGRNPNDIFTDNSLVVTGNWAGTFGPTGASANGVNFIQCCSDPAQNLNAFARMPNLIAGRDYLLMISNFTNSQIGYDLVFSGGTAVITDTTIPRPLRVVPECDGSKITLYLNKKMKCNSITSGGTEFILSPAVATITSAVTDSCTFAFDFDEVTLTLSQPLTNGNYELIFKNGTDGNTLRDHCDNAIPVGEKVVFTYLAPVPIRADSIGRPTCSTDSVLVYFPKKIKCSSISAAGTDFSVNGPAPINIVSAGGRCVNDLTDYIIVKFSSPIVTAGSYSLTIQPGIDGSPVFDACGQPIQPQILNFITADTVNADFTFSGRYGCLKDTFLFTHNGANGVNQWLWTINGGPPVTTSYASAVFPASSVNQIRLFVSNGTCTDTSSLTLNLNHEVKASFIAESVACPDDTLRFVNTSRGEVDRWNWNFGNGIQSNLKDPPLIRYPLLNREVFYTVRLIATNLTLNCSDTAVKIIRVLDHCYIDVPTGFTPNNDGLNDTFRPYNALRAENYEFSVYNRWGQLLFHTKNWQQGWDGTYKGLPQPSGIYIWTLRYIRKENRQPVFRKGTVMLIR
ncbi:MAG: gliding motility-associated C-terminal domain-containing protein [Chitinophagaceae bacterium]|nr:gliding motility-associated C-terminal domain-containing protein [Chitinophagaceae bacterium]